MEYFNLHNVTRKLSKMGAWGTLVSTKILFIK